MTLEHGRSLMRRACAGAAATAFAALVLAGAGPAAAGKADVMDVTVKQEAAGTYRFDVTVRHTDAGWDHYADRWEVLAPDGAVLGIRELAHPHVNEQPFTRSLSGVKIPDTAENVTVRARDSRHGFGGAEETVALPR